MEGGRAHLEGGRLEGGHLEGGHLEGGHLKGGQLEGGHLEGEHLSNVDRMPIEGVWGFRRFGGLGIYTP